MFSTATRLFEGNVDRINALNVFPVPDGDTGTNMFLTLREVAARAEGLQSDSATEVASAMAKGALLEARGNSGVILCQFFKGVALGLDGKDSFGAMDLAQALRAASDQAYTAVGNPVEGTLLTVIRRVADAAERSAQAGGSMPDMFHELCDAARDAVAETPTMLPVLREAGVVDAGGQGLAVILEGARAYVGGDQLEVRELEPPEPQGVDSAGPGVSLEFLNATEEDLYGYCTQLLVEGDRLDLDAVRTRMAELAQSTVVVGDDSMVKVHVHAHDPGPVVSYAVSLGTLTKVSIECMDDQHREYSAAQRDDTGTSDEVVGVSVVAVGWGDGLEALFRDFGAGGILPGGDTMNPSVQQILNAIESAQSQAVVFLPNNRNIVPAARQAAELAEKPVRVVPSLTVPQGIAAMLAFNPELSCDENAIAMEREIASVRTGEVCDAVREVELNGVPVRKGQAIGLLERELVAAEETPGEALASLLRSANVEDEELVTLYWGGDVAEEDAGEARALLHREFPNIELDVVYGGQPHYHYIVSIE
jgi:DAK2 domain fusion protein YloV